MSRVHDLKTYLNAYETNLTDVAKKPLKSRCRSQSPVSDKGSLFGSGQASKSLDSVEIPGLFRVDALSVDESNINFSYNKDLWQKRANYVENYVGLRPRSHKHTPDLVMDLPLEDNFVPKKLIKSFTHSENLISEVAKNDSSPSGPESPDMSTAAERFAKQNQSTLKKNTKIHSKIKSKDDPTNDKPHDAETSAAEPPPKPAKPHIKAKPQVLKKPFIYFQPAVPNVPTPDN